MYSVIFKLFSLWHFLHPCQRSCPQIDQLCPPGGAVKLLAVQRRSVGLVNVKSRHFDVVQSSVSDPVALTFDVARGSFFWANNLGNIYKSDGQLSSTFYSGLSPFVFREKFCFCFWPFFLSKQCVFFPACFWRSTGEPGITGLACDWLTGNLFWANQRTESIYMHAADGSSYATVLSKYISPSDLVLLPVERCASFSMPCRILNHKLFNKWIECIDCF